MFYDLLYSNKTTMFVKCRHCTKEIVETLPTFEHYCGRFCEQDCQEEATAHPHQGYYICEACLPGCSFASSQMARNAADSRSTLASKERYIRNQTEDHLALVDTRKEMDMHEWKCPRKLYAFANEYAAGQHGDNAPTALRIIVEGYKNKKRGSERGSGCHRYLVEKKFKAAGIAASETDNLTIRAMYERVNNADKLVDYKLGHDALKAAWLSITRIVER
jgi:hypothetical protein